MKTVFQSKTIWANLIGILLGVLPLIDGNLLQAIGIANTQSYLTVLGFGMAFLNIILRTITNQAIGKK
jgi:hypothetical protein